MARIRYYDSTTQEWVFADLAVQAPLIEGTAVGDTLVWDGTDWVCRAAELSVLPALYQEVEYISGDGTQYLQLGFPLGPTSRAVIDLERLGPNAWGSEWDHENLQPGVFGCGNSTTAGRYDIVLNNYGLKVYCDEDYYQFLSIPSNPYGEDRCRALFDFDMTTGKYYVDGSQAYSFQVPTTASTYNACIFATNIAGTISNKITMRMYGAEFYTSGTLISKLIPCYRISDNVIGVYDIVSNTFLTNAGTGVFGKGANISGKEDTANKVTSLSSSSTDTEYPSAKCVYDIVGDVESALAALIGSISTGGLPSEYEAVDYIESSGTQYIDTGYTGKCTDKIDITFQLNSNYTSFSNGRVFSRTLVSSEQSLYLDLMVTDNKFQYIVGDDNSARTVQMGSADTLKRRAVFDLWIKRVYAESTNSIYRDDVATVSKNASASYYIFAAHRNDGGDIRLQSLKLYSFIVTNMDGEKVVDLVPCVRVSDSEAGLYDTVRGTFLTNQGTGSFIIPT